jgi:hypothetical protein
LRDLVIIDGAAFTVPAAASEPRVTHLGRSERRVRCASVLKPLYFWAASTLPAFCDDPARWAELADPAVTLSANDPTVSIWQSCGPEALLDAIARLTGVRLRSDPTAQRSFGRVLVHADEVASAYAALAVAARSEETAARLLGWMRQVPERQTFGARAAAADRLGVDSTEVGVKTGWYIDADERELRTHAVTVTILAGGSVRGTAVLTALPVSETVRADYATTYVHGEEVLPIHWDHAAETISRTTSALL